MGKHEDDAEKDGHKPGKPIPSGGSGGKGDGKHGK